MAKKRSSKVLSDYKKLLIKLAKFKCSETSVNYLKKNHSKKDVEKHFSKLANVFKEQLIGVTFPKNYENIETNKTTIWTDLENEIWWSLLSIELFSKEINSFMNLSEKYYHFLIFGLYDNANAILNQIENTYGVSSWLIENRVILYSNESGLSSQKAYTVSIMDKLPNSKYFLLYFFSQKLESEFSYEQFIKSFNNFWEKYPDIKNYYSTKCIFLFNKIKKPEDILIEESSSPIIDRYLILKKVLILIMNDKNYFGLSEDSLYNFMLKLSILIKDEELKPLLFSIRPNESDFNNYISGDFIDALDYYTIGNYAKSYESCLNLLNNKCTNFFSVLELLVKSEIRCGSKIMDKPNLIEKSIIQQMYENIRSIINKDSYMISSLNKLLKLSMELSNYDISNRILLFIHKNLPYIKSFSPLESIKLAKQLSLFFDIRQLDILEERKKEILSKYYQKKYFSSITYRLYSNYDESLVGLIPEYRLNKYHAKKNISTNIDKIKIYINNINNGNKLDKFDGIIKLTKLYFEQRYINECITTIVEGYILNNNIIYSLPISEIVDYIEKNHEFEFDDNICTSILYDIYSKHISSNLDSRKAIRYEIFLENKGYTRPTELIVNYSQFDSEKINYFLQYLCVKQVLDSSIYFSGTKEVENERIQICQFLLKYNPNNKKLSSKEIKEITESSIISDSIMEIEQHKIYVNTEGIMIKLEPVLNEYYLRYISLINSSDYTKEKLKATYIYDNRGYTISCPENDITPLLYNALKEVRDYFVLSNEYGLNGYLSTNIRHGKLANFLRGSLISSKIMAKKDNEEDPYEDNEYWKKYYLNGHQKSIRILLDSLTNFSESFEKIIDKLRHEYIQINTEENKSLGLFNYHLMEDRMILLHERLASEPTYEDFENQLFGALWDSTEHNLELIRDKITNEIAIGFQNLFKNLSTELESIKNHLNLSELRDAISLESTNMQRKIEIINGWFTRKTSSDIKDFTFNLPISIAEEIIKNIHVNMDVKIGKNINRNDEFEGNNLKGFVDILYILFENAIKHSKNESAEISIDFLESEKEEYFYKIKVQNEVSENLNLELANQKLNEIREIIRTKMYGQKVSSEGGTGFYKIVKILMYDLTATPFYLDFYFDEKRRFIVDIHFDNNHKKEK